MATTFPILAGNRFSIVLLDECSQMVEPMSLLPLAPFGTERFLAVGDPHQLPPTLRGSRPTGSASSHVGTTKDNSLSKTLFVRLSDTVEPVLLRKQYRCHPTLTAMPNRLFYGSKLQDGISAVERPPLLDQLPPFTFCNISRGAEKAGYGGSLHNDAEVRAVSCLLGAMLSKGVPPSSIGVIALYKNQAKKLAVSVDSIVERNQKCQEQAEAKARSNATAANHEADDLEADSCDDVDESTPDGEENSPFTSQSTSIKVSTVDAFQVSVMCAGQVAHCLRRLKGGERDIILVSCCRTNGIGFLGSRHRMNVALTRARSHLVIM